MLKVKDTKIFIMGIQGSGKTHFSKWLIKNCFQKPIWYLIHKDDIKDIPKKCKIVMPKSYDIKQLDELCKEIIELGKKKECDCFVIDEADMFLNGNVKLPDNINDLVINHRHYNLAVVFITRRPQDIPPKIVESCAHTFIFAQNNADNIDRKLGGMDKAIPDMLPKLDKERHNYIHKEIGEAPKFMKPIQMKGGNK